MIAAPMTAVPPVGAQAADTPADSGDLGRRHLTRWYRLFLPIGIGLVVVQILVMALIADNWRDVELRQADERLRDDVIGLSEHASQALNTIDATLISFVEGAVADGSGWFEGYDEALASRLMDRLADIPHIRGFLTISPHGMLASDHAIRGSRELDLSDRPYVRIHQQVPDHGLYLSGPMLSRSMGTWFLSASRGAFDDDGELLGVVAASVEPLYFSSFYANLSVRPIKRAVFQADGTVLSAYSPMDTFDTEAIIGQRLTLPGSIGEGVSYRGPGLMSSEESLVRIAPVPGWDWVIAVEMPVDVALEDWYEMLWALGEASALAILVIVAALVWIGRHQRLLQRAYETISQHKAGLEEQYQQLQETNRSLEEFTYAASHDLQEPLRKIEAFSDRLTSHCTGCLNARGTDYVDRIRNASGRLRTLIDDLLALSRVNTADLAFAPTDLGQVVSEAIRDLDVIVEQSGAVLHIGEPLSVVDGDALMLRQLAQNLLSNALKFHREGVRPEISISSEISTSEDGRAVCRLTVRDNGIGFEQQFAEKIMRPFQRLHGRSAYRGTGIGLAICTRVAERHDGTLTAVGTPGEGAAFTAELPVRRRPRCTKDTIAQSRA